MVVSPMRKLWTITSRTNLQKNSMTFLTWLHRYAETIFEALNGRVKTWWLHSYSFTDEICSYWHYKGSLLTNQMFFAHFKAIILLVSYLDSRIVISMIKHFVEFIQSPGLDTASVIFSCGRNLCALWLGHHHDQFLTLHSSVGPW